jgi:hypothetical protein
MPRYPTVRQLWVLGSPLVLTRVAWAARSAAYRVQWTLGDLVGTMASVGVKHGSGVPRFAPRSLGFVRPARFLLACVPGTDYHALAYSCWHGNLRGSGER